MAPSIQALGLIVCLLLGACSSDPETFLTYTQRKTGEGGKFNPQAAPKRTDALALNYANGVEAGFRAKSNGARAARESSDTALAGFAAFAGAAQTLAIGASGVSSMGLASGGIVALRTIFDAKGRATAFGEAAERIHAAIKDYGAYNLNDVSPDYLTPNGWTLANVVQSNIDIVNKILNGHLPAPQALAQASEKMTKAGATRQRIGATPVNNIPAASIGEQTAYLQPRITTYPQPAAFSPKGVPPDVRKGRSALSEQVVLLRGSKDISRAGAVLAAHHPPIVAGEDPIETLGMEVSGIRSMQELRGWRDAFSVRVSPKTSPPPVPGPDDGINKLPPLDNPRENTKTPDPAPKRP